MTRTLRSSPLSSPWLPGSLALPHCPLPTPKHGHCLLTSPTALLLPLVSRGQSHLRPAPWCEPHPDVTDRSPQHSSAALCPFLIGTQQTFGADPARMGPSWVCTARLHPTVHEFCPKLDKNPAFSRPNEFSARAEGSPAQPWGSPRAAETLRRSTFQSRE